MHLRSSSAAFNTARSSQIPSTTAVEARPCASHRDDEWTRDALRVTVQQRQRAVTRRRRHDAHRRSVDYHHQEVGARAAAPGMQESQESPQPFPLKRRSERRTATAPLVPKGEDFDALRICNHPVVDVVANAREVKTANACEEVFGTGADLGLNGDKQRGAFEFLANSVGRLRPVDAPLVLGGANLCPSEVADLDGKRSPHSRRRSSETRSAMGSSGLSHTARLPAGASVRSPRPPRTFRHPPVPGQ